MAATVSSAFRTKDEVSPVLANMRKNAAETDVVFAGLGERIDKLGSRQTNRTLKDTSGAVKKVGDESAITGAKVKTSTTTIKSAISGMERESNPRLERLKLALKKVQLDPVKFAAEARIIKAEIRSLEQSTARSSLSKDFNKIGLAAGDLGGALTGGGRGGRGRGGLISAAAQFGKNIGFMGIAIATALPAVVSLTGAISALIGSFGAATLGAGAIGAGVFGAAAVGIGGIVSVVKPAITQIKNAKKAQDAYNKAVQQFGDKSKQAQAAAKALDAQFKNNPGMRTFLGNMDSIEKRWSKLTRPGQRSVFGIASDASTSLKGNESLFADSANKSVHSLRTALTPLFRLMDGKQFHTFITTMTTTFSKSVIPFGDGLRNIASAFQRISIAASPYVIHMFEAFDRMTGNFARNQAGVSNVGGTVTRLIGQTKSWFKLFGAFARLAKDFFGAGSKQGQGLVQSLTGSLNKADSWVKRNPAKIQNFFSQSISATKQIATAFWDISKAVTSIARQLGPVLSLFTQFVSQAAKLHLLGPLLDVAGIGLALRGGVVPKLLGLGSSKGARGAAGITGGEAAAGAGAFGARGAIGRIGSAFKGASFGAAESGAGFFGRFGAGLAGAKTAASRLSAGAGAARGLGSRFAPTAAAIAAADFVFSGGSLGHRASKTAFDTVSSLEFIPGSKGAFTNFIGGGDHVTANDKNVSNKSAFNKIVQRASKQRNAAQSVGFLNRIIGSRQVGVSGETATSQGDFNKQVSQIITALKPLRDQYEAIAKAKHRALVVQQDEKANKAVQASQRHGAKEAHGLADLFTAQVSAGVNQHTAFKDNSKSVLAKMQQLKPAGAKILAQQYVAWAEVMRRNNPKLAGQIDSMVKKIGKRLDDLPGMAGVVGSKVYLNLSKAWQNVSGSMKTETEKWRETNQKAFTDIQRTASATLRAMGFSPSQANDLIQSMESGGAQGARAKQITSAVSHGTSTKAAIHGGGGQGSSGLATGGRIRGLGRKDTVPIGPNQMAAPGELVVNRHTEAKQNAINRRVGAPPIGMMANSESRRHDQSFRGIMPGLATGGRVAYYASGGRIGGNRVGAMVNKANEIDRHHYNYEWGGGHSSFAPAHGTGHGSGPGIGYDCSGAVSAVLHAGGLLGTPMTSGSLEGIGLPGQGAVTIFANPTHTYMRIGGKYFGTASQNPGGGAGWFNGSPRSGFVQRHLNLAAGATDAFAGIGAGGGVQGKLLQRRIAAGSGLVGIAAQRGLDIATAAANQLITAGNNAGGTVGGSASSGSSDSSTSGANQALGRKMMIAAGWPANQWGALKALWTQESGWNANAVNPSSGAYGIPQSLGHGHPYALGDAQAQIAWGLNYIKGRYGSPSAAEAHEKSFNWYGKGGDFIARKPQLIGVGDNPHGERVTVTPLNKQGGGSVILNVKSLIDTLHVNYAGKGDLKKAIEKELEDVAKKLGGMILDHAELMS